VPALSAELPAAPVLPWPGSAPHGPMPWFPPAA